eukprot:6070858-Amphidinium_carterae.1
MEFCGAYHFGQWAQTFAEQPHYSSPTADLQDLESLGWILFLAPSFLETAEDSNRITTAKNKYKRLRLKNETGALSKHCSTVGNYSLDCFIRSFSQP